MNTVLQSPASADDGFDAFKTQTSAKFGSMFQLSEGYHDYRFDWFADSVQFFLDGQPIADFTANVPTAPGHLMLSHWSNGNPGWSGEPRPLYLVSKAILLTHSCFASVGPPVQDAVTTVSYFKAYFNKASSDNVKEGCPDPDKVCHVPDDSSFLMALPDSSGPSATPTTTADTPLQPTMQGLAASRDVRASNVTRLWVSGLVIGLTLW